MNSKYLKQKTIQMSAKGILNLILGLLMIANIIYKIFQCASCKSDFIAIEMHGYLYISIHVLLGGIFLYTAYGEMLDSEK